MKFIFIFYSLFTWVAWSEACFAVPCQFYTHNTSPSLGLFTWPWPSSDWYWLNWFLWMDMEYHRLIPLSFRTGVIKVHNCYYSLHMQWPYISRIWTIWGFLVAGRWWAILLSTSSQSARLTFRACFERSLLRHQIWKALDRLSCFPVCFSFFTFLYISKLFIELMHKHERVKDLFDTDSSLRLRRIEYLMKVSFWYS